MVSNDNEQKESLKIRQKYAEIIWIGLGNNQGFSVANNVGIKLAKGKNILLLNADTSIPDLNVILNCIVRIQNRKDVMACSVLQKKRDDSILPLYKSFAFRKHFFLLPPFCTSLLDRIFKESKFTNNQQVEWLSGAFMMIKAEAIAKAGLMDEDFFLYAEDVEWSARIGKFGKLLLFEDLYIYHFENEENPHRVKDFSFINKFDAQIQLSNLLWIRKQFGLLAFLILIFNYLMIIPVIFTWKITSNLMRRKSPFEELENQKAFTKKTFVWLSFFWDIVFLKSKLYKINSI